MESEKVDIIEYECGVDLAISRDMPEAVLELLFAELDAAIRHALRTSKLATEWKITELGYFEEKM